MKDLLDPLQGTKVIKPYIDTQIHLLESRIQMFNAIEPVDGSYIHDNSNVHSHVF